MLRGIESNFISAWEDWEDQGTFALGFSDIVLTPYAEELLSKYQVPNVPFTDMIIDGEESTVMFFREDETQVKFKIGLVAYV